MSTTKDLSAYVARLEAKAIAKPAKAAALEAKLDAKIASLIAKGKTVVIDGAAVTSYNLDTGSSGGGSSGGGSSSTTGSTVALATGVDIISHNGTLVGADSGTDTQDTLNSGDTLTGSGSADTLRAIIADTDNPVLSLTGIETVRLEATAAATLNAQSWTGLTKLEIANAGLLNTTTLLSTVNNLRSNPTISLENVGVQTSLNDALAVSYAAGSVGSTGTLTIQGNGVGGLTADGSTAVLAGVLVTANNEVFNKIVLNSVGVNRVEVDAGNANDFALSNITVTGSGATSLDVATASVDTVTTVDLSAATGAVTLVDTFGAGTSNVTVTGGSGNDTVTVDATRAVTVNLGAGNDVLTIANATSALIGATDTFNLGDGTADVVVLTSAQAQALDDADTGDTASLARLTNYERLRLSDGLQGDLDVAPFGVSYFEMGANGAADSNLNNVANNATIQYRSAYANEAIVNVVTPAGNDDVINLFLNANLALNDALAIDVRLPGVDTLNVTTADRSNSDNATDRTEGYTLSIVDGDDAALDTMVISGTQFVSYTATATSTVSTINASASSGDLTINLALITAGEGATITGSTGVNTLTGTGIADTITGGARNDSVTGGLGADTMTGNGGSDVFVVAQATDSEVTVTGTSVAGFDTITDFAAGDTIDFTAGATAGSAAGPAVAATTVVISAGGKVTFASEDDTLAEKVVALAADDVNVGNAEVVFFEHGSDTYIYGAGADTTAAADDFLIKLAGVSSQTTLTGDGNNVFSLS